jgi:hypothetical protein
MAWGQHWATARQESSNGPAQANLDVALSKSFAVNWPHEESFLQFRAEFTTHSIIRNFPTPKTTSSHPHFGVINSTSVNARVAQLALRFVF